MSAEAIGAILSAIAAFTGVFVAWTVWQGQKTLTTRIASDQQNLAQTIGNNQVETTKKIAEKERLLTQRQLLLPLWQYMSNLDHVKPHAPITPDVLKIVNTLELVALCCEGELIDPKIVKRTFSERYIELYQEVLQCNNVPKLNKSGQALLNENRAAVRFYDELRNEHISRDTLTS